ncbi:hypothetical protein J6590_020739 [Homalodisca vitripennis]|nr:hypothetical protein J6590_020739 [Homalodisca vitripennis]
MIRILTNIVGRHSQSNKKMVLLCNVNVDNLEESHNWKKLEQFTAAFNVSRLKFPPTKITHPILIFSQILSGVWLAVTDFTLFSCLIFGFECSKAWKNIITSYFQPF